MRVGGQRTAHVQESRPIRDAAEQIRIRGIRPQHHASAGRARGCERPIPETLQVRSLLEETHRHGGEPQLRRRGDERAASRVDRMLEGPEFLRDARQR